MLAVIAAYVALVLGVPALGVCFVAYYREAMRNADAQEALDQSTTK